MYERALLERLADSRRSVLVLGPRQVGKTTMVQQLIGKSDLPVRFASADEPALRGPDWIAVQWEAARLEAGSDEGILVLDEGRIVERGTFHELKAAGGMFSRLVAEGGFTEPKTGM